MLKVEVKDDKISYEFDYYLKSLDDFNKLSNDVYKPIFGEYKVGLYLRDIQEIKSTILNSSAYSHFDVKLLLDDNMYKRLSLALPDFFDKEKTSLFDYLKRGIAERGLLLEKKALYTLNMSVGKSVDEIDLALDILSREFGSYVYISEKDMSKYIVLNKTVFPRTVLIKYINLDRYRASSLDKCLASINNDIVIASMVRAVKALHKQKCEYLKTGLGSKFISNLNTRNLNLLYYLLVVKKPYHLNDIKVILEIYERGVDLDDLLYKDPIDSMAAKSYHA